MSGADDMPRWGVGEVLVGADAFLCARDLEGDAPYKSSTPRADSITIVKEANSGEVSPDERVCKGSCKLECSPAGSDC